MSFKEEVFIYGIVFLIVVISIKMYLESDAYNLKCIVSTVDGDKYCVRETAQIQQSADLLAKVAAKCKTLVAFMKKKYPDRDDVDRLYKGFNETKITETLPTSTLTAYSENKGQKIAFCLNKKKGGTEMIDINTLTFVAIHELSHIMTISIGHNQDFWENFKFLLEGAIEIKIYIPEDYKEKPKEYCSMMIKDNPYYDI